MSAYTEQFLRELVGDIRVDMESEEIKDIKAAVEELLQRCMANVESAAPYFKSSQMISCGSMAEETRIWKFTDDDMSIVLEFDFLAKLQCFEQGEFQLNNSCGGFSEVTDTGACLPARYSNTEKEGGTVGVISAKTVSFDFRVLLMKSVAGLCNCHVFDCVTRFVKGVEVVSIGKIKRTKHYKEECNDCKVRKSTGTLVFSTTFHPIDYNCSVVFLWKRNPSLGLSIPCELSRQKKEINKDFIILIDFLPTIEATEIEGSEENHTTGRKTDGGQDPSRGQDSTRHQKVDPSRKCFLVPKCCRNEHDTCWKMSHCLFEIQMMRFTDPIHRQCYMILKFIFDYLSSDIGTSRGSPTTYVLKTAVLHHIEGCHADTPDLTKCTIDIVTYLADSHTIAHLPHLLLKGQNFLTAPSVIQGFRFKPEHMAWSENRNRLLGRFWAFLLMAFNHLDGIVGPEYNFDMVQTALKFITTMYGLAYTNTTFKVSHEPDEDKFLRILSKIINGEDVSIEEFQSITKVSGDVEDQWEKDLSDEQLSDAVVLYSQMQVKVPEYLLVRFDMVNKVKKHVQHETLYSRTEDEY